MAYCSAMPAPVSPSESVLASVRINLLLSYQSNDMYSALQTAFEGGGAGDAAVRATLGWLER